MAIPKGTTIPSGSSQFFKPAEGPNKVRFLSDFSVGWEGWKDKKPLRHAGQVCRIKPEDVDADKGGKPQIKYFWAAAIWNYQHHKDEDGKWVGGVQVYEITQKSIMQKLQALEEQEDWGDVKGYDVSVRKEGSGMETEYDVIAIPPKPLDPEIQRAYAAADVKVEALFEGGYPMPKGDGEDEYAGI